MKKINLFLFCVVFFFQGCNNVIWDFVCHNVDVTPCNVQGENLLQTGAIDIRKISIDYNGKTFVYEEETKFNPPAPLAIRLNRNEANEIISFSFGEFTPTNDYKDERFTIHWGDGTSDEVSFDLYTKGTNRNQKVKSAIYLNGADAGSLPFQLTVIK